MPARLALAAVAVGANSTAPAPSAVIGAEQDSTAPAPSTLAVVAQEHIASVAPSFAVEAPEHIVAAAPAIAVAIVAGRRARVRRATEGLPRGLNQAPVARKARVYAQAEGCDTPPSAAGRRLCVQAEAAAATYIVPAPSGGH